MGKVRADFKGEAFFFYDNNSNPKKAQNQKIREQLGVLFYKNPDGFGGRMGSIKAGISPKNVKV